MDKGASPDGDRATHEPSRAVSALRVGIPIAGPSVNFLNLTRNTNLESPTRFVPTVKGPDDVVI